jgi:hypothetical protein
MPWRGSRTLREQPFEVAGEVVLGTGLSDAGKHLAGGDIESADQRLRSMADVLELLMLDAARAHR